MPLSDAKLRNLKAQTRPYKVADGGGLHVLVTVAGARLWRMAYRFSGKQKTLAFGIYPEVGLADARSRRDEAKRLLALGIDPAERKVTSAPVKPTFRQMAEAWFATQKEGWVESYASRLRSRLDDDLLPSLGDRPVDEIESLEVLAAVRKIERRGSIEMARRVRQMAGAVFKFAVAEGKCSRDPSADVVGALAAKPPVKSRKALLRRDLPDFLARLSKFDGEPSTIYALRLTLLTLVRTQEVRFAEWREFEDLDGEKPLWRIPAERMKMRNPHLVPLSRQTVETLMKIRTVSRGERLFAAKTRSGVISENTMLFAMYRMGYHGSATVHGFRSTASTVLNEEGFNRDWVERQLSHVDSSVRGVYNAAEYLDGRRQMLQWWADFIDTQAPR